MADLLQYALTNVSDVKETLGIDSGNTAKDNLIKRKINQVTEAIEAYCLLPVDHHFKETEYTNEEYDSTGVDTLSLKMRPVTTFTTLESRDTNLNENDWTTVDSEFYFVDKPSGVLQFNFTAVGRHKRFRATYTAGYETIPADLSESAVTLAAHLIDHATSGFGVKRKKEGQREIEYFDSSSGNDSSLIKQLGVDEMLDRYVMHTLYER